MATTVPTKPSTIVPGKATPVAKPQIVRTPRKSFEERLREQGSSLMFRKLLLHGPPNGGKTTFIGSAAFDERLAPVLVLDFEGGKTSLEGIPIDLLEVFKVNTWQDYNEAHTFLKRGGHRFKTVAIDSISETHVFSLLNIVADEVADSDRRDDENTVEQSDYGKSMVQMRRFIRSFRDLPMHFICTSHTKSVPEPRVGTVKKPSLFGQMADEIVGMFDYVGYLALETVPAPTKEMPKRVQTRRVMTLQNAADLRVKVRTKFGLVLPIDSFEVDYTHGATQFMDLIESVS